MSTGARAPLTIDSVPRPSARRRRTDQGMRIVLFAAAVIAVIPLVLVIYYLIYKGISLWSWKFFSTDPNGNFLGYPAGSAAPCWGRSRSSRWQR
jgi:ABC-type phosphate transport system permease subunit